MRVTNTFGIMSFDMFELPGNSGDTPIRIDLDSSPIVVSAIKIVTSMALAITGIPKCRYPMYYTVTKGTIDLISFIAQMS